MRTGERVGATELIYASTIYESNVERRSVWNQTDFLSDAAAIQEIAKKYKLEDRFMNILLDRLVYKLSFKEIAKNRRIKRDQASYRYYRSLTLLRRKINEEKN